MDIAAILTWGNFGVLGTKESLAEVERLRTAEASIQSFKDRITFLEISLSAIRNRDIGVSEQITEIALLGIWEILGVKNQTEAVLKLRGLMAEA